MHPRTIRVATCLTLALGLGACSDALAPEDLTVDFQISAGHIHALETEVTYTVLVTDTEDQPVTDFESLSVEYALEGTNEWRTVALSLQAGGSYQGTHQYPGPGDFEVRVVGTLPGQDEAVLHQLSEPLHAVRPHFDAGGYRVEFEAEPWDYRPDVNLTLKFLVMEDVAADPSGNRPPITGLTGVTIVCTEPGGGSMSHNATETTPGTYQAAHAFQASGEGAVTVRFTGNDGQPAEVTLPLNVEAQ
jgi:hypothetical protein